MKTAALVFPNQLFEHNPAVLKNNLVYLVEESLFFKHYNFHKQKLALHRATLKFYQDYLQKRKTQVVYIESNNEFSDIRKLVPELKQKGIDEIHFTEVWINTEDFFCLIRD